MTSEGGEFDGAVSDLDPRDLVSLCEKVDAKHRDGLLQCLAVVAPRGGEAVVEVLEQLLMVHATE